MKHDYRCGYGFRMFLWSLALALASTSPASAAIVLYTGYDPGAGPGNPHPNSTAAESSFMAAAGATTLIDFESAPLGDFAALNLGSGVTATLANVDTSLSGISNDNSSADLGFNVTPGGSQFVRISPNFGDGPAATLTFSFGAGISAFGAYLTGTETGYPGAITLTFNDGSAQSLAISKNATAGTQYFGFMDSGASIMSVSFVETGPFQGSRDIWGVDDVRFAASAIPEPTSLVLLGLGSIGLAAVARRGGLLS